MGSELEEEWIGAASLWMVSMRTGELAATAAKAKLITDLILDDEVFLDMPDIEMMETKNLLTCEMMGEMVEKDGTEQS